MMKESPFHEMQLFRHLKKPFWDIKILILALLLGAGTTFAGAVPQQLTVSGTVTDLATGDPMPGVNIVVKGTVVGTLSGPDGKYSLAVTGPNDILVFSFIGYNSLEVALAGRTTLNVELESATTELDEVIVTGYGTQKKSDLTGSVVRVTMDDKASLANMNISQALSGATAGVNVQGSGLAGTEPDLSIRGQTSLSASDRPLIVLDGIIFNGAISDINVSDVESIDILKDASAAAVYGSRSANGVMLITTKRGKSAKPVVSFNMYYGYQDMTNNPMRVMNAQEYAVRLVDYYYQQDLYSWYKTKPTGPEGKPVRPDVNNKELVAARLRTQEERDNYMAGNEIDWVDEITHIAPIQNYNINVSGKTTNSNYYVSGSYTNEEGILRNDKYSRFTLHSNLESKITDWFTLSVISSYSYRDYSGLNADLGHARSCSPLANNKIGQPVWDMYLTGEAYMPYPLNNLYVTNEDKRNSLFMVGSGKITVPWVKGLTYELNYSNTFLTRTNNSFYPVTVPGGAGNKGRAY